VAGWSLYVVRTRSGALYTGITTDVARRIREHAQGASRGAKSLRARGPLALEYQVLIGHRALAQSAERRMKRLPKRAKESIVAEMPGVERLLARLGVTPST
jgi:putative endonuclease